MPDEAFQHTLRDYVVALRLNPRFLHTFCDEDYMGVLKGIGFLKKILDFFLPNQTMAASLGQVHLGQNGIMFRTVAIK